MHAPRSAYTTGSPRSRSIHRRLVSAAFAATVTALVAGTTVGAAAVPQGVAPPSPGPVGVVRPTTTVPPPPPPGPVGVPTSTTLAAPPTRPTVADTVPPTVSETLAPVSTDAPPETPPPPPPLAPPPPPVTEAPQPPSTDAQFDVEADAECVWTAVDDYYTIAADEVLEPAGPTQPRRCQKPFLPRRRCTSPFRTAAQ